MHVFTYVHIYTHMCVYVYVYACRYVFMCMYVDVYVCVCMYMYMNMCTYKYVYAFVCICTCRHTHVYAYLCICMCMLCHVSLKNGHTFILCHVFLKMEQNWTHKHEQPRKWEQAVLCILRCRFSVFKKLVVAYAVRASACVQMFWK